MQNTRKIIQCKNEQIIDLKIDRSMRSMEYHVIDIPNFRVTMGFEEN